MDLSLSIIALVLLTFFSGYFSASEIALFSLPQAKVKSYENDPSPRKKLIAHLLQQPRDLLVTVFMLNTLVNILLQNVASYMFGSLASWALKVGVPLVLTLVLGEIIPKYLGLIHNTSISYQVVPTINFLQSALAPIRKMIISITYPISRAMFFFLKKEESISKEELLHVLKTSEEHGVLNAEESELVWGYLNLQDMTVKELMRPRNDVLFYDIEEPLTKLTYLLVDQEVSRLPVCEGSLEKVLGIITAKDFFLHRVDLTKADKLFKVIEKPFFVPETTLARILLRRFDEQDRVIALVVDEYGSISGLITREDIIEVVIGQIEDLRDQHPLYSSQSENEIITSGRLELIEFNEIFGCELTSDSNMVTIGGWLTEKFGDIPKSGTKVELENFLFHVLSADPNRIRKLYVRRLKKGKP